MDKDQLLFLCKNYKSLTREEGSALDVLVKEYPYSQLIQSLAARAASQNRLADSQTRLQMAAVYSTDRAVLKRVVTAPPVARPPEPAVAPAEVAAKPKAPEPIDVVAAKIDASTGNELADRVMADLEQLKESKHHFEMLLEHLEAHPGEEFISPTPTTKPPKKGGVGEEFIQEIKSSKKKIKSSDPKHKEQIDIINQFIKSQPSIGKVKPAEPAESVDLSEKSNALGDHLVSETLVEILLKQGKKEKAIEMLRKLIWKFPQKKAYFAAQIEKLKL